MLEKTRFWYLITLGMLVSNISASQMRMGLRVGGTVSSVLYSPNVYVDAAQASHADIQKPVNTYFGGAVFQFKVGKTIIIRPAIEYFKKSWEVEANDRGRVSAYRFLSRYDINYIELPVNFLLTTPLGNGKIYLGLGPYASYAVNGKVKVYNETYDLEFKRFNEPVFTYLPGDNYKPVQFINHYTINRIDYGANGLVGYEFAFGLFVESGIDIGVRQISTSLERYDPVRDKTIRDPDCRTKFSIFHAGAGWMMNFKRHRQK